MSKRFFTGAVLLFASQIASAGSWSFESVSVAMGHDNPGPGGEIYAVLVLSGGSRSSCVPMEAEGHVSHATHTATYTLAVVPEGVACFSAFRPWEYAVRLPDAVPGETYAVELFEGAEKLSTFSVTIPVDAGTVKASTATGLPPAEGMWWSSEKPGTGVAFNVDKEGRWFGALYLYEESGESTFLTLQGESLAYDLDATPSEPYAIALSPVIRSEGGQCLDCPWTRATVSDTGDDAQLIFHSRNRATLTIGTWSLDLTPLTVPVQGDVSRAAPEIDRYYALIVDGSAGQHVAVVRGVPGQGAVLTGQTRTAMECVDCRTVGDDGKPSDPLDNTLVGLIEDDIGFLCTITQCSVEIDDQSVRTFVDKAGKNINAFIPAKAPATTGTTIELRLLPEDWRP